MIEFLHEIRFLFLHANVQEIGGGIGVVFYPDADKAQAALVAATLEARVTPKGFFLGAPSAEIKAKLLSFADRQALWAEKEALDSAAYEAQQAAEAAEEALLTEHGFKAYKRPEPKKSWHAAPNYVFEWRGEKMFELGEFEHEEFERIAAILRRNALTAPQRLDALVAANAFEVKSWAIKALELAEQGAWELFVGTAREKVGVIKTFTRGGSNGDRWHQSSSSCTRTYEERAARPMRYVQYRIGAEIFVLREFLIREEWQRDNGKSFEVWQSAYFSPAEATDAADLEGAYILGLLEAMAA